MVITQGRLKELLDYNPETGVFTWLVTSSNRTMAGTVAGCNDNGYIRLGIDGKRYRAHRLAWLYVKGYLPEYGLDHKDRIRNHNWINNLRPVSQQCNMRNTGNRKNNTSGVKGVSWNKTRDKWDVNIWINRKRIHLGQHTDFTEAACHRLAAEQCIDWEGCDSSSPAYQYVQASLTGGENNG